METQQTKSQEIILKAGIAIRLSLAEKIVNEYGRSKGTRSTGEHKVKFLEDKVVQGKDFQTGVERLEMKWIFEEDGQRKFYTKPLRDENGEVYYLIQSMAKYNYGDELILKYVSKGLRGYIDVRKAGEPAPIPSVDVLKEVDDSEIPIIEDTEEIDVKEIPF